PRDRTFIVKLEKDLQSFIMSNTDSYLLAPMNSYYRLITHQTAEYYCLGHTL
ncbi:Rbs1p CYBJADRAFT_118103, partial [Cyberlindnera jadinii NRRL Y-1542]